MLDNLAVAEPAASATCTGPEVIDVAHAIPALRQAVMRDPDSLPHWLRLARA